MDGAVEEASKGGRGRGERVVGDGGEDDEAREGGWLLMDDGGRLKLDPRDAVRSAGCMWFLDLGGGPGKFVSPGPGRKARPGPQAVACKYGQERAPLQLVYTVLQPVRHSISPQYIGTRDLM